MKVGKSALLALVRLSQEDLMLCQPVVPPLACKVASGNESERKEWQERVTKEISEGSLFTKRSNDGVSRRRCGR